MNTHSMQPTSRPAPTRAAVLAKSAVCVAMIAGIAWIGFTSVPYEVTASASSASETSAAANAPVHAMRAEAHRRQVFEERRARFEGRTPTQVAGGTNSEYPMP